MNSRLAAIRRHSRFRHLIMAKEGDLAAPSKEKLIDVPYETRIFRKKDTGEEVSVRGFRERLEEAYKTYEANNKAILKQTLEALKKYQETLSVLNEATNYDIKTLVAEVNKAKETNQEVFEAINQIAIALQTMAQNYPDIDETANQIIIEMMNELVGVGALNASNEALKTMTEYLEEYDEITVNFYRVVGGGREKGERVREYFTIKKRTKTEIVKAGTAYKEALLRLNNQLQNILENAKDAGAELIRFAKEVIDVMALWSLYLDITKKKPTKKEPVPKMIWKGKEMTEEDIKEALMQYEFYREIGTDLSFRSTREVPAPTEVKLHAIRAMIQKIKAKIESIVNAPAYAAGAMQEYADICSSFTRDASAGLREITAEIYGAQLTEKEGKGLKDRIRDLSEDFVPEPMLVGAAARRRIFSKKRIKASMMLWKLDDDGLQESTVPYFEMDSKMSLSESVLNNEGLRSDIIEAEIFGKEEGLIDWDETEENAEFLFSEGFYFKPNEGLFYSDYDGEETLVVKAKSVKEVFDKKKKNKSIYFEFENDGFKLNVPNIEKYLFRIGWRTLVDELTGDKYAIKMY